MSTRTRTISMGICVACTLIVHQRGHALLLAPMQIKKNVCSPFFLHDQPSVSSSFFHSFLDRKKIKTEKIRFAFGPKDIFEKRLNWLHGECCGNRFDSRWFSMKRQLIEVAANRCWVLIECELLAPIVLSLYELCVGRLNHNEPVYWSNRMWPCAHAHLRELNWDGGDCAAFEKISEMTD